jgi:hypothetical protein
MNRRLHLRPFELSITHLTQVSARSCLRPSTCVKKLGAGVRMGRQPWITRCDSAIEMLWLLHLQHVHYSTGYCKEPVGVILGATSGCLTFLPGDRPSAIYLADYTELRMNNDTGAWLRILDLRLSITLEAGRPSKHTSSTLLPIDETQP